MADQPTTRASFRDPGGRLVRAGGRVLRLLNEDGATEFRDFFSVPLAAALIDEKKLVGARELPVVPEGLGPAALALEHEAVWFPSHPYEWPPEMLHAAGELTLELFGRALEGGYGLKDASPYNLLFEGPAPVFVDWLSFEKRDAHDPLWMAQAQFARIFLLPLLAWKHLGLPTHETLLANRDGLEPAQLYSMLGFWGRLSRPALSLVTLPQWLSGKAESKGTELYVPRRKSDARQARFVLNFAAKSLGKKLATLAPASGGASTWSDYMEARPGHYEAKAFSEKEAFVRDAAQKVKPARVLDVGCNTGHFSEIAAGEGARVVAIDLDPVVVGMTWRRARKKKLDIQPLVVNLARPTPATGWRNAEYASFLDRAQGKFELVLMLAVVHHLLVTERIPLEEIAALISEITTDAVVIEYVDPADPMFRRIARGREHLHADLSRAAFESVWKKHFEVAASKPIGETRALYLLRRK